MNKYIPFKDPPIGSLGFIKVQSKTYGQETFFVPCVVHTYLGEKPIVVPLGGQNTVVIHSPEEFLVVG